MQKEHGSKRVPDTNTTPRTGLDTIVFEESDDDELMNQLVDRRLNDNRHR